MVLSFCTVNNVDKIKDGGAQYSMFCNDNGKVIDDIIIYRNNEESFFIIVNASNEVLVNLFLNNKIGFLDIVRTINKIFKDKEFKKYATRKPASIKDIQIADNWARLKTFAMCVR